MSKRAKVLQDLYRRGKVTIEGLQRAVLDGTITQEEYLIIISESEE